MAASPRLFFWQNSRLQRTNFGDYLSLKLVERIVGADVDAAGTGEAGDGARLLAIGSILHYAQDGDVIWGSGVNGNHPESWAYHFGRVYIRAVRGPLTQRFVHDVLRMDCPAVFGDPALLLPAFFPEFQRAEKARADFIILPHFSEKAFFPRSLGNVFYPDEDPWEVILAAIVSCRLVIATSLHGLIVAEAFGVPARMLRITANEALFKYEDYYLGTGRPAFRFATSVNEALSLGGEPPAVCDLRALYQSFPRDLWPEKTQWKTLG